MKRTRVSVSNPAAKFRTHTRRDRALRQALTDSAPGDRVRVHDVECLMDSTCRCRPIVLVVGPRA